MIEYVKSLLPRLQQISKNLNDTAIFVDVPWIFIDGDGDRVTYVFRRNNELLVSKRGEVSTGRWEYLSAMQSLLIEHAHSKRMFNQGFIDNAVMALRKDGTEELFLLANQQILPDLDLANYLDQKIKNPELSTNAMAPPIRATIELRSPHRLVLVEFQSEKPINSLYEPGNKVFDMKVGRPLENGRFYSNSGFQIEVKNGKIKSVASSEVPMWYKIGLFILALWVVIRVIFFR